MRFTNGIMTVSKLTNDFEVYAATQRDEMLPFIPKNSQTVLDVGCSTGNFGELIKKNIGSEVWGVEVNKEAASIAETKLNRVLCEEFNNKLDLPHKYFDCIVFNDVLEHMIDPFTALIYTKDLLKSSGKVVASIPNVRYFGNIWSLVVHKNWEYEDAGILDRTHLRFFTVKSISNMLKDLEYEIESISGINPLEACDPYYLKKFNFFRLMTFNQIEDMRWKQFAVVAAPIDTSISTLSF